MLEYRVFGPPGTGKTTYLAEQIKNARFKYHPNQLAICSFTRTAALEIADRAGGAVAKENAGTIHSLCYRRMGAPKLVEVCNDLHVEWGKRHGGKFGTVLGGKADRDGYDGITSAARKDNLLDMYNLARLTKKATPFPARDFAKVYEQFKKDFDAKDFVDLLEQAPAALDGVKVLFVDEAQDLSPLQWEVVRKWGEAPGLERFIVSGDDDQSIFSFAGANVEAFLTPIPEDRIRVLGQSYRLSRSVHSFASKLISGVAKRQAKTWSPREEDGYVVKTEINFKQGDLVAKRVKELLDGGHDETVMVLASCDYMLAPVLDAMREAGLLWHNPYRRENSKWNPLGRCVTSDKVCAFARLSEAFKSGDVKTLEDASLWRGWASLLNTKGVVKRGKVKALAALERTTLEYLDREIFEPGVMSKVVDCDWAWLENHLAANHLRPAQYAIQLVRVNGLDCMSQDPRVIVGTIHSVKGGEANHVLLCTDISTKAKEEFLNPSGRAHADNLRRLLYVGATRARVGLTVYSQGPNDGLRFVCNN